LSVKYDLTVATTGIRVDKNGVNWDKWLKNS